MRPEDLLDLLRAKPFEPFRIFMSDWARFDVTHPELAIVLRSRVIVAVPGPKGPDGPAEKAVNLARVHITRMELLNGVPKRKR